MLAMLSTPPSANDAESEVALIDLAARLRQMRRVQAMRLGEGLFADPAWEMLLDLLVARSQPRPLSVSALCAGAGVALTTAWRHLATLEERGLVVRWRDPGDARRSFIVLSPAGHAGMTHVLHDLLDSTSKIEVRT